MHEIEYEGPHWRDNNDFSAQDDSSPDLQLKASACDGWEDISDT